MQDLEDLEDCLGVEGKEFGRVGWRLGLFLAVWLGYGDIWEWEYLMRQNVKIKCTDR